jgi:hypothetical protein
MSKRKMNRKGRKARKEKRKTLRSFDDAQDKPLRTLR